MVLLGVVKSRKRSILICRKKLSQVLQRQILVGAAACKRGRLAVGAAAPARGASGVRRPPGQTGAGLRESTAGCLAGAAAAGQTVTDHSMASPALHLFMSRCLLRGSRCLLFSRPVPLQLLQWIRFRALALLLLLGSVGSCMRTAFLPRRDSFPEQRARQAVRLQAAAAGCHASLDRSLCGSGSGITS